MFDPEDFELRTFKSIKFEKIQDVETIISVDQDYILMVDHLIMRLRVRGNQLLIKQATEEVDTEGVFSTLAKGIWGLMGATDKEPPKEVEDDGYSKLDIHKVKLTTQLNLASIFAEKDRIFTDFQICRQSNGLLSNNQMLKKKSLILCDRSGRIYFMDIKNLLICSEPLKGYRDVQICLEKM